MFHVPRSWSGNVAVLVLLVASLTSGCVPAPTPATAERVTPTPAPIGTVVTPVSAVLSITPINAAAVSPVVLVAITTATPGAAATGAAASAPASPAPSPTQAPVAVTPAGGSAAPQQPPEQIASSGRITSVQLSSLNPVQLPCPDPRITIGVLPVPASSEVTLSCQAVDATQVQQPPGPIVAGMVFRLFTDRAGDVTLPAAASLGIAYGNTDLQSDREADLVIGHLQGALWSPVPSQQLNPAADYASATIIELGTYALYLKS